MKVSWQSIINIFFLVLFVVVWFFAYTQLYQDNNVINNEAQNIYLSKWTTLDQTTLRQQHIELMAYNTKWIDTVVLSGNIQYVALATMYENYLGRINYTPLMNEEEIVERSDNGVVITLDNINHKKMLYPYSTVCQMIPFMKQKYCFLLWEQIGYRITITKWNKNDIFEIIAE